MENIIQQVVQRNLWKQVMVEQIEAADSLEEVTDVVTEHITHISKDETVGEGCLPGDMIETEAYSTVHDSTTDAYEESEAQACQP